MKHLVWCKKSSYSKAYSNECVLLYGSVGEWLKPADCKSAPSGYESSNLSWSTIIVKIVCERISNPNCQGR